MEDINKPHEVSQHIERCFPLAFVLGLCEQFRACVSKLMLQKDGGIEQIEIGNLKANPITTIADKMALQSISHPLKAKAE